MLRLSKAQCLQRIATRPELRWLLIGVKDHIHTRGDTAKGRQCENNDMGWPKAMANETQRPLLVGKFCRPNSNNLCVSITTSTWDGQKSWHLHPKGFSWGQILQSKVKHPFIPCVSTKTLRDWGNSCFPNVVFLVVDLRVPTTVHYVAIYYVNGSGRHDLGQDRYSGSSIQYPQVSSSPKTDAYP